MLINNRNSRLVLILTFFATVLPPLGNDIYFASLPTMAHDLHTAHIGWVVSMYLVGFALAQLFYGPLSERFGRRPLLITAISLVLVGCVVIWLTPNFTVFLVARFIQAVGACGTLCMVLAIIRDSYQPEAIVKVSGVLFAVLGFVPAFAPLLGSLVASVGSWRTDFLLIIVIAVLILFAVVMLFSESIAQKNPDALRFKSIIHSYRRLLSMGGYMSFCLVSCFSYACFFSFICASPYLLIKPFGLSMVDYGWLIAFNGMGIVLVGFLVPLLSRRFSVSSLALSGSMVIMLGAILMWVLNSGTQLHALWRIMLPGFVVFTGVGFIRPTASAGALTQAPRELTGPASALFSFLAFIGGAVFSLFGQYAGASVMHLSAILFVAGGLTLAAAVWARKVCGNDK